jgi:hypothetical protein
MPSHCTPDIAENRKVWLESVHVVEVVKKLCVICSFSWLHRYIWHPDNILRSSQPSINISLTIAVFFTSFSDPNLP